MHEVDSVISANTFLFVQFLSPPQRPPTVAPWEKYTRGARRLGRGKIKARGFSGVY